MSRQSLDRPRSNIGPGSVHYFACVSDFLRRRYADSVKPKRCIADDLGMSYDTVRKWLFREPQHQPGPDAKLRIARVYGPELAAEAGMTLAAWREAFLFQSEVLLVDAMVAA